ncbi:MAG TPA: hypothetical protein VLN49_22000 [Gemmatimonadaceae bacterium]|nr:hypothetical protein [Gemmatimonadaceae bacterium]
MANGDVTIAVLAGLEVERPDFGLSAEDRRKLVETLREKARELPQLAPHDIGEELLGAIFKALKKPLAEVLEEVWKQRKEMRDAAGKTMDEKASSAEVELFSHTVEWALHPTVKVTINGMEVKPTLKFDAVVSLELEAVKIIIERAHITKFMSGTLTSTITLKYKSFPLMNPVERKVDLPGQLVLPRGGINLSGVSAAELPPSRDEREAIRR